MNTKKDRNAYILNSITTIYHNYWKIKEREKVNKNSNNQLNNVTTNRFINNLLCKVHVI